MNQVAKKQSAIVTIGPDQYIEMALANNAGIETLERLFDLKAKHDTAEAKKEFIKAMQHFQSIKPDLPRTQQVSFGQGKTAYNFCPLYVIESRLRDPLTECGLSYRFENLSREGAFGVRCVITHLAGHSEGTEMYAPADGSGNKNAIQGIGSTSTYLMRYTLIAAFALTTADEDNDGATQSDMPYNRLLQHNEALRDNLSAVAAIKEALTEKDYYQAVIILDNMSEEIRTALWVAPTKGGVFTTEERAAMKSNEFHNARLEYIKEKQESV